MSTARTRDDCPPAPRRVSCVFGAPVALLFARRSPSSLRPAMTPAFHDLESLVAWARARGGGVDASALAAWLSALLDHVRADVLLVGRAGDRGAMDAAVRRAARGLAPPRFATLLERDAELRAAVVAWLSLQLSGAEERPLSFGIDELSRGGFDPPVFHGGLEGVDGLDGLDDLLEGAHGWDAEASAEPRPKKGGGAKAHHAPPRRSRSRESAPEPPLPPSPAPAAPPPALELAPPPAPEAAPAEAAPEPVFLGAAAPKSARPGDWFQAELVAYVEAFRATAAALLARDHAPGDIQMDTPAQAGWKTGAPVVVRLTAPGLHLPEAEQSFTWDGKHCQVEFDVQVPPETADCRTILRFEAFIGGVRVGKVGLNLEVAKTASAAPARTTADLRASRSAFVSYSRKDQDEVYGRVATLRAYTGDDFFVDRLKLRMGRKWAPQLEEAILETDEFLLFWSEHAGASEWVRKEWEFALAKKGGDAFQVHLLKKVDPMTVPEPLRDYQLEDPLLTIAEATRPKKTARPKKPKRPKEGGAE